MNNYTFPDERFIIRKCPICNSAKSTTVLEIEAASFCNANWTYASNFREILHLPDLAFFSIEKCNDCSFYFSKYLPCEDFLTTVYDEVIKLNSCAEGSENLKSYGRRLAYLSELLTILPRGSSGKILDYGCGVGIDLKILKSLNIECIGYEPSRVRKVYANGKSCCVSSDKKKIKSLAPYDAIIIDNVLEHVAAPRDCINLLSDLSHKKTILYVSVPDNGKYFMDQQRVTLSQNGLPDMSLNPWEHLNYFDMKSLDSLLLDYNFHPVRHNKQANIGLRNEKNWYSRIKNSLGSIIRFVNYAIAGKEVKSPNHSFYEFGGK